MRADLAQYTKEEIAEAFRTYMDHVLSEEGTTFVARYPTGIRWPDEKDGMALTTVNIIHAIDEALGE